MPLIKCFGWHSFLEAIDALFVRIEHSLLRLLESEIRLARVEESSRAKVAALLLEEAGVSLRKTARVTEILNDSVC